MFEKHGISKDMENQVESYMIEIRGTEETSFEFMYKNDSGDHFFSVKITDKIDCDGYFNLRRSNNVTTYTIFLKDRNDIGTLLHEVKHMDYTIRNNGKQSLYKISQDSIDKSDVSKNSKGINNLKWILYIYNDDEFQAKYQSMYKDFEIYLDNIFKGIDKESITRQNILGFFKEFIKTHDTDTFQTYLSPGPFSFKDYIRESELDKIILYYISDKEFNKGISSFLSFIKYKFIKSYRTILNSYTPEQKKEIDKIKKYFESDINKKQLKYQKRTYRVITLMYDKYHD